MATDFDIDLDSVRAFLAGEDDARKARLDLAFRKAWKDFEAITARIIERHSPRRIYQWGSLLDRSTFSEISDIDIAVEGLPGPEAYFALVADISSLTTFPLDIIEMEKAGLENADHIRREGRLVYEQD